METKKFSPYSKVRKSPSFLAAKKICEILQKSGFEAYFVGGCVRDLIISPNKMPKDIDIATSALPENIMQHFSKSRFVGEAFGVCLVQINSFCFEVATFRVDGEYIDKRRPKFVTKGNLFEDSCRRDFTINALYYNPCKKIIKDMHGGIGDIKDKIIRCVGNAENRFDEDALRVLRALRFSADLGFALEFATKSALLKFSFHLQFIAKERVLLEFNKVKKFSGFVKLVCIYLKLNMFFKNASCFHELALSSATRKENGFSSIPHTFLRFLLHLSLLYKIELSYELLEEINSWPLSKQDSLLCKLYLKLFFFEDFSSQKNLNLEEGRFLLFIHLMKINKICPTSFCSILKSFIVAINSRELFDFLKLLLEKPANFSNHGISDKIVESMLKLQLPNYYTQSYIDYYHYKSFMGAKPQNIGKFVLDNIDFIQKIQTISATSTN